MIKKKERDINLRCYRGLGVIPRQASGTERSKQFLSSRLLSFATASLSSPAFQKLGFPITFSRPASLQTLSAATRETVWVCPFGSQHLCSSLQLDLAPLARTMYLAPWWTSIPDQKTTFSTFLSTPEDCKLDRQCPSTTPLIRECNPSVSGCSLKRSLHISPCLKQQGGTVSACSTPPD